MARRVEDLVSPVVVANPDEDCTPTSFRALLDELAAEPAEMASVGAAETVTTLRELAERE